ncbi:FtsW/RodA/SpoVE family cell cycle protein, partial [Akkermansia muciniphila]|uniref:FtsW/RodA/SpoVE family cell cycle protein n=1 Tax=Akkermansia muciniphila TaxID=239935 RepID=UPI00164C5C6A
MCSSTAGAGCLLGRASTTCSGCVMVTGAAGGACFLLVLCYVPGIGKEINGERRWITIGMQFQPSECAKLCMMMALANWLALYRDRTTSFWWGFVMPGLIFGIPLALILFEKDMGTSVA